MKSGLLHCVDKPHQFLGSMRQSHIIVLAFSSLLGKIGGKDRVPNADVLGSVVNSKA